MPFVRYHVQDATEGGYAMKAEPDGMTEGLEAAEKCDHGTRGSRFRTCRVCGCAVLTANGMLCSHKVSRTTTEELPECPGSYTAAY